MHLAKTFLAFLSAAASLVAVAAPAHAASDPSTADFFEKRVRPVLVEQCYKCHSTSSPKLKANLCVDSLAKLIQGGDSGPAVVPGHPEKSLLIEAISYTNEDMKMPPKNQLSPAVVADLTAWVKAGAPWPGEKATAIASAGSSATGAPAYTARYEQLRKEHWAWQPLHEAKTPPVKNGLWVYGDIDRFILARLEARGLAPVGDADRAALIRRATFDLTGLPPTPEEVGSFLADASPDAFAKVVDRLLASPAFGERWGRHWLDVARYAESTGSSRNIPYGVAWRYRDYVIDALNKDKPYDRFVTEQLAGDLLPYHSPDEHNEQMIATGFLAVGVKDLNERDRAKFVMDNVDEQIDVTTRSILALTVACARCHDHKFDPITQADYYAVAGIFKSTNIMAGVRPPQKGAGNKRDYGAPNQLLHFDGAVKTTPAVEPAPANNAERFERLQIRLTALKQEVAVLRRSGNVDPSIRKAKRQEYVAIQQELAALRNGGEGSAGPIDYSGAIIGVQDSPTPADCAICLHGEPHDLGSVVRRGFVPVVPVHSVAGIDPGHSGRLELAQWLVSQDNPLTARVMVNRIWSHLFGEGIVRTVDNFGSTGEAPANPELLDHLATRFMDEGWSVKRVIRQIMLSHSYQLSSQSNAIDFRADPGDRLNWRMAPRRLDAEEIRDAMLAAGGKLQRQHAGGSMAASLPLTEVRPPRLYDAFDQDVRSVYLPIFRDLIPPVLDLFDFAEPTMVIGARDSTTVPTQALFMLNDPFVSSQARRFAERLADATGLDDAGRIDLAYRLALSRPAGLGEKTRVMQYLKDFNRDTMTGTKDTVKGARFDAWASFCQVLLGSAEFRYLQ